MAHAERTADRLRAHYDIERALADRLRTASREQRGPLYRACYDELFRRVPDHPQLTRKADPGARREAVAARRSIIRGYFPPGGVFMEVGPGDCSLATSMCDVAAQVYAVDVSSEITGRMSPPPNFELRLSDGANIPLPDCSVDVAFSYQLIEHLHEQDAADHLREVHRTLKGGGTYLCVTPSRLNGPHDISRFFDETATGFHMREYTHGDLIPRFRAAGFDDVRPLLGVAGRFLEIPSGPVCALERVFEHLPHRMRRRVALRAPWFRILGVTIAARRKAV